MLRALNQTTGKFGRHTIVQPGVSTATHRQRRIPLLVGLCVVALTHSACGQDSRLKSGFSRLFSKTTRPAEPTNALIQRARQDMATARKLAAAGQFEQAIVIARRAQKLAMVSERTTRIRWRANEESPTALITRIEATRASERPTVRPPKIVTIPKPRASSSRLSNKSRLESSAEQTIGGVQWEDQQTLRDRSPVGPIPQPRNDRVIDRVRNRQRQSAASPVIVADIPAPIAPDPDLDIVDSIAPFEDATENNTDINHGFASPLIRSGSGRASSAIDPKPNAVDRSLEDKQSIAQSSKLTASSDDDPMFTLPQTPSRPSGVSVDSAIADPVTVAPVAANSNQDLEIRDIAVQQAGGSSDSDAATIAPAAGFGEPNSSTQNSSSQSSPRLATDNQPGAFKPGNTWTQIPKPAGADQKAASTVTSMFPKVEHAIIEEPKVEAEPFDATDEARTESIPGDHASPSPFLPPIPTSPLSSTTPETVNPFLGLPGQNTASPNVASNRPASNISEPNSSTAPKTARVQPQSEVPNSVGDVWPESDSRSRNTVQNVPARNDESGSASVWTSALIHVLSTLIGFVLALLFLFRYGSKLGLTLRVEHVNGLPAANHPIPVGPQDSVEIEEPVDEVNDVDSAEPARKTAGVIDPPFPFRVVGSYEDDRLAAEQVQSEREQAMIKHIFEQNLDLHRQLTGRDPAA